MLNFSNYSDKKINDYWKSIRFWVYDPLFTLNLFIPFFTAAEQVKLKTCNVQNDRQLFKLILNSHGTNFKLIFENLFLGSPFIITKRCFDLFWKKCSLLRNNQVRKLLNFLSLETSSLWCCWIHIWKVLSLFLKYSLL
jgi:hypothetical protein